MAATAILIHFRSHRHRRFLLHNATSTVRFYSSSDDNPISSPNSDYSVTDIKTTENTRTTSFHNPIPTKVDSLEAIRKNLEAYRKPVQPSQSLPLVISYQELYQRNKLPKPDTGSGSISQEFNEIVDQNFHLDQLVFKKVRDKFKVSESDYGSARVQEELNERLQKVQEMEEKEIAAEPIGPLREGLKKLSCVEQTKTKEEELDERLQKVREVEEKEIAAGPFGPLREGLKKLSCVEQTKTKEGSGGCLYVKVSMDGAPYLSTIDLKTFHNYAELFKTIEKMFSCFTLGHPLSEGIKNGSQWVLTHEDKDGDWMLVGDVPWEMFIDSCKRLRIMKTSKAIG